MSFKDILYGVKYPVKVTVLEQLDNMLKPSIKFGRVIKQEIKAADGIVRSSYFIFKDDKDKLKLPVPDRKFFSSTIPNSDNTEMMMLKIDRTTYLPITNSGHQLTVQIPHPVFETIYKTNEKTGERKLFFKLDANNQKIPVIETTYELDGDGEKVLDKKTGKPIIQKREQKVEYEQRVIFDSHVMLKNGKVELPAMIANQSHDIAEWAALEYIKSQKLYKLKGFWQNNMQMIIQIIGIIAILAVISMTYSSYEKTTALFTDSVNKNSAVLQAQTATIQQYISAIQGAGANIPAAAKPPM